MLRRCGGMVPIGCGSTTGTHRPRTLFAVAAGLLARGSRPAFPKSRDFSDAEWTISGPRRARCLTTCRTAHSHAARDVLLSQVEPQVREGRTNIARVIRNLPQQRGAVHKPRRGEVRRSAAGPALGVGTCYLGRQESEALLVWFHILLVRGRRLSALGVEGTIAGRSNAMARSPCCTSEKRRG